MRYFIHSAIGGVKTTEADVAKKPEPASNMQVTIKPFTQRTLVVPILGTTFAHRNIIPGCARRWF